VSDVCCQVEVSVTGLSPVQGSPTECGVSECDSETSTVKRPVPTGDCRAIGGGGQIHTRMLHMSVRHVSVSVHHPQGPRGAKVKTSC
jgi:hypothetical protein